jgi:hypothetical protein
MTITQMDGINYLPDTRSYQSFLDRFDGVIEKGQDRFTVRLKGGSRLSCAATASNRQL